MIPYSKAFVKKEYAALRATKVQEAPAAVTVNSIAMYGRDKYTYVSHTGQMISYQWLVTLASMNSNLWDVGMRVTLSAATSMPGTYYIIGITSGGIIIETQAGKVAQTSPAGTATPSGIVTSSDIEGTNLYNNLNDIVGIQYDEEQNYLCQISNTGDKAQLFQVIETSGVGNLAVTMKYSLDKVHWADLPTPIADESIGAGESKIFRISENILQAWLKITVQVNASATYYVIAK